ncbi:WD40 repeat-like protein [Schizophyllum commune H4-8]|uniref:WD40 repeat-like protein n=1 Tax=Schizophyllum commune (strain H4-8 / FGSC 9210) TaxID=578458 RepID=UPI00215FFBDA|nr:WD40 repeat-like protein [Schizophyllum commune H4-8]KAI5889461.1 WD40 repeat-like protein [Schizophyllum commune H4-8]
MQAPGQRLYAMYEVILQSHFDPNDGEMMDVYQQVLAWILLAHSAQNRAVFVDFGKVLLPGADIDDALSGLSSLLTGLGGDGGQPVRPLHSSFRDFILDAEASGAFAITIDPQLPFRLADTCFRMMGDPVSGLRFNICRISTSFVLNSAIPDLSHRVKRYISPGVQYACRAAGYHLQESTVSGSLDAADHKLCLTTRVHYFLQTQFLFWLEACSWLNLQSVPSEELQRYLIWAEGNGTPEMRTLIQDCIKFNARFREGIMASAPQTYTSGLVFSPRSAIALRKMSGSFSCLVSAVSGDATDDDWPDDKNAIIDARATVKTITYSLDGKSLIACVGNYTVRCWNVATGNRTGKILDFDHGATHVVCSSHGTYLAFAMQGTEVRFLDLASGHLKCAACEVPSHQVEDMECLAFSRDARTAICTANDYNVRVFDPISGIQMGKSLVGHSAAVIFATFLQDNNHLASFSQDNTLRVWHWPDGRQIRSISLQIGDARVRCAALSPDGGLLVTGSWRERVLRLWDVATGDQLDNMLIGHLRDIRVLAFSPDGTRLASGSRDCTVRVWDILTRQALGDVVGRHDEYVNCLAFSPDGRCIASGADDRTIRVWDIPDAVRGDLSDAKAHNMAIHSIALSPDARRIFSGSEDRTVRGWDAETGEGLGKIIEGCGYQIKSVAYSPTADRLAAGSNDCTVQVKNLTTGDQITLEGHTDAINCVVFSPDGTLIASGSDDGTVRVWDLATGKHIGEPFTAFATYRREVSSVAFSSDGQHVAAGLNDCTIRILDLATRKEQFVLHGCGWLWVNSVAYSPDGQIVAAAYYDTSHPIWLWDASSGQKIGHALQGHESPVNSLAFSPDGKYIASGSDDNTVRLWSVSAGRQVGVTLRHEDYVNSVAFASHGRFIVSGSKDYSIRVWDTAEILESVGVAKVRSDVSPRRLHGSVSECIASYMRADTRKEDGWLRAETADGSLVPVLWIPYGLRHLPVAFPPHRVISPAGITIDVRRAALGEEWTSIYNGLQPEPAPQKYL